MKEFNVFSPEQLAERIEANAYGRGLLMKPLRIFICSPYRSSSPYRKDDYIEYAKALCQKAIAIGVLPFAPHLFYPQILGDDEKADAQGRDLALLELEHCDGVLVGDAFRVSQGMHAEINRATTEKKPIAYVSDYENSALAALDALAARVAIRNKLNKKKGQK
jgi:hypothetical protein